MTRAAKKVLKILHRNGFGHIAEISVERSYAGRHQRAAGWCVWLARNSVGIIICGGSTPIRDLRVETAIVYKIGREWWMNPQMTIDRR